MADPAIDTVASGPVVVIGGGPSSLGPARLLGRAAAGTDMIEIRSRCDPEAAQHAGIVEADAARVPIEPASSTGSRATAPGSGAPVDVDHTAAPSRKRPASRYGSPCTPDSSSTALAPGTLDGGSACSGSKDTRALSITIGDPRIRRVRDPTGHAPLVTAWRPRNGERITALRALRAIQHHC